LQDEFPLRAVAREGCKCFEVQTSGTGIVTGEAVLGEQGTDCIFGLGRRGEADGGPSYEYAQCAAHSQRSLLRPLL
jgi:hypothetical protein